MNGTKGREEPKSERRMVPRAKWRPPLSFPIKRLIRRIKSIREKRAGRAQRRAVGPSVRIFFSRRRRRRDVVVGWKTKRDAASNETTKGKGEKGGAETMKSRRLDLCCRRHAALSSRESMNRVSGAFSVWSPSDRLSSRAWKESLKKLTVDLGRRGRQRDGETNSIIARRRCSDCSVCLAK